MRLQEEKEEERKRIVKTERERMRKELRRKEWHYSVAFKASLVGFLQQAKCRLRVQLRICPDLGGCWYPTAAAVRRTGSTIVRQQHPRLSSAPPAPTTTTASATATPSAATTTTPFVAHAHPNQYLRL